MRYAVFDAQHRIVNIIDAHDEKAVQGSDKYVPVPLDAHWSIGGIYDGANYTPPESFDPVPKSITRTQARLTLHRAGLLEKVLEVIAAGGIEAQIWYEANEWHRASPILAGMAQALGFTDDQVDNLFRVAGAIVT